VLGLDLSLLVEEALSVQSSGFIESVDKTISLLRKENGQVGNLTVVNRLVKLNR
jgi:hypothetical protein